MSDKKREMLANLDMSKPLNELPDCIKKYEKILTDCNSSNKYSDSDFKPDDESLGAECTNRGVS